MKFFVFLYPQCSAISAFKRGSTQNARIASWVASWVLSWVASWVFSCGPTFSTAGCDLVAGQDAEFEICDLGLGVWVNDVNIIWNEKKQDNGR